jgi:Tfp pilus assembly protein PilF
VQEVSVIQENSEMKKYIVLMVLAAAILNAACGRKSVPAKITGEKIASYDAAAYDYVYIEAVKQKLMGNAGEALKYFDQCVKVNPKSDAAWYQMAQIVASNGDLGTAKKYAAKAVAIDDRNLWYQMLMSGIYYQEKNIDSAIVWYEKAVKSHPDNESIQLSLGNLYIENKNYDKANSIFDAFDKKYGVNEESTIYSVRSLMASGKFSEAQVKIEALLKEKPDEVMYNGILAEILHAKGDNEKAMEVYNVLMERNPGNPQVQLALADFLVSEKNYTDLFPLLNTIVLNNSIKREEKITFFARLTENPDLIPDKQNKLALTLMVLEASFKDDDIVPLLRADLLVKQSKLPEAALRLEDLIKANPQNYYAWEKLLLVYLEEKDYEKLTQRGEECSTKFNMSFLAKVLYANGALETGKYEVALNELKKAEIIAGDNKDFKIQVLTMRADVYYRMKDYQNAFAVFEQALQLGSDDLTVLNNYAYYLAEQDTKLKEAEELARKVVQTEKGNATFLDTYGWVLYKRGKLNEAAKVFQSLIEEGGEKQDAEWYEHYGYILKKQKKYDKAIESWQTALKLDPSKTHLNSEIENCKK